MTTDYAKILRDAQTAAQRVAGELPNMTGSDGRHDSTVLPRHIDDLCRQRDAWIAMVDAVADAPVDTIAFTRDMHRAIADLSRRIEALYVIDAAMHVGDAGIGPGFGVSRACALAAYAGRDMLASGLLFHLRRGALSYKWSDCTAWTDYHNRIARDHAIVWADGTPHRWHRRHL